jgi:tetratricopeptide (TPR) repeat protein
MLIWRKGTLQHREDAEYVRHIDIAPTILEAIGAAKNASLPGMSLAKAGGARDTYFESLSTSLNRGWAPLTGVIHGGLKYIDLPLPELYDLPKDPREEKNLRAELRRDVEAARAILSKTRDASIKRGAISAEEAAQLRALGYVSGTADAKSAYTAADDPKNLVDLDNKMHQVIEAYEQHDVPRALKLAREVVAARPAMVAGRELLAFVLQQSEQVGDAVDNLRAALRTNDNGSVRVRLGLLLTEQGKNKEAIDILAPLAKGTDPEALNAYGIALAAAGRLEEAAPYFQRVLQLDSNNAPAMQNLGIVALRRGDVAGAQQFLTRALEMNPRLPLALNTMGVVYARQGDFARAVESWNRAVEVDPRQYDALYNIGLVEGRAGHVNEARSALTRFVQSAPKERYGKDLAVAREALAALAR